MKKNDLVAYASSFASFLLKRQQQIRRIILFGSVARGDFDKESDIDLFIETDEPKNEIQNVLELYEKSQGSRNFRLEGIENTIVLKAGKLEEWPSLRRSMQSGGIVLYGPFNELPEKLQHCLQIRIVAGARIRSEKIKLWRLVYGYNQKVGKKSYRSQGMVGKCGGKKIAPGIFFVPIENSYEIESFLKEKKIEFKATEVYIPAI
ncbi:nucleotidyltransferase domain-containing protein [Candidatus Woesearchaeota archaeon]|nr:nucleotidyltransferase domain-containing protein [Candidatus Woesearchaeota archaeon]